MYIKFKISQWELQNIADIAINDSGSKALFYRIFYKKFEALALEPSKKKFSVKLSQFDMEWLLEMIFMHPNLQRLKLEINKYIIQNKML